MSNTPKSWYRDSYMVSTAPQLIQPSAVNDAFDSDFMWWQKRLDLDIIRKILGNSLCFGLYKMPSSTSELAGKSLGCMSVLVQAHHGRWQAASTDRACTLNDRPGYICIHCRCLCLTRVSKTGLRLVVDGMHQGGARLLALLEWVSVDG